MSIRERLRAALRDAMKARDKQLVSAIRIALGAIDNAEAADLAHAPEAQEGHIAGGVHGLGAGEVVRVELTEDQMRALVLAEASELPEPTASTLRALLD